jgi:hypothetical protein
MDTVIDWLGLVAIAERRDPTARRITVAGLLAEVVPSRGTDVGFYVRQVVTDDYAADAFWAMRTERELILLRALVEAGAVTAWDPAARPRCFITGCASTDLQPDGRVHTITGQLHTPCRGHWAAIFGLLGEQP